MSQCRKCKEQKPQIEFPWKNKTEGKRHTICKKCRQKYQRERYQSDPERYSAIIQGNNERYRERTRRFIYDYLRSHPCVDCGEGDPVVLEFDHVVGKKDIAISAMARGPYSIGRVKQEIAKCEIRCANCHRRKHAREQEFWITRYGNKRP